MKKALVIGSLNMDMTAKVEKLPKLGETIFSNEFYESCGGKGANQAVAIAKLGMNTTMIGMVGNDFQGEKLIENLIKHNVKADNIIKSDELTGRAVITVDKNGNNNIIVIPGSNFKITKEHIQNKEKIIFESDIVILQNEIPIDVVEFSLKKAKELNKITIFNPAPATELSSIIYENTDYLILNETETEEIFGININDKVYIGKIFHKKKEHNIKNIILTLGEKGSILFDKDDSVRKYDAYEVNAVDTTAAGDSFIGAFALKICETNNPDIAIKYATAVSAIVVTRQGAQDSIPTVEEIEKFMELNS
ncbi:ribokinase [Leptotrichia sp. OH3620_COT-345]|uniref:ribokinase n=1 Tax=Leptotrichia sp. OH3620_COT-345 TaxID=2491048 RepID=UPI000F648A67|nr:ribokinase [Leptotrichia sp. OH3620_COT-345]RRD40879.1 ribokinase [Leptotrichia sp. OH3620_COT-345]